MHVPLLAIAVICGAAAPARADEPVEERSVDLVVAGSREDAAALAEVVAELLRRLELTLRAARVDRLDVAEVATPDPAAPPAVARVWIDLAASDEADGVWQASIYVVDGTWERTRIRRVAVLGGVDEVAREELCSQLGLPLEPPPPEPDRPPPEPVPVREPPRPVPVAPPPPLFEGSPLALDLGLGYELTGYADAAVISHGPVATLELAFRRAWLRPALGLTMQYRVPLEIEGTPFGARLDQAVFRLTASIAVPLVEGLQFAAQVGGGLDVVWTSPRLADGASGHPSAPSTAYFGMLRAAVGLRVVLGGSFAMLALVGCDVDGQHRTYVAIDEGVRQLVLEPWPVRPLALLTFTFDVLDPLGTPVVASE